MRQFKHAREEVMMMIGEILNSTPLTGAEATKVEVSVFSTHCHTRSCTKRRSCAGTKSWMDYMLTMDDVQAVNLRAKLVALSCCHSGKGKVTGEDVVGIARAFLGAGARSVLMSPALGN